MEADGYGGSCLQSVSYGLKNSVAIVLEFLVFNKYA